MKYYLGIQVKHKEYNAVMQKTGGTGFVLFTYADCNDSVTVNQAIKTYDDSFEFIIDSGAFSLWNTGKTVNREDLLRFYKAIDIRADKVRFINLDVIPGSKGKKPTKEQALKACQESWDNFLWFKSNGIDVLPVFHQDDDFDYLYKMMQATDYIAISPANDSKTKERMIWLDKVYKILRADYKTHGLAATALPILQRYPFYSVDSINWKSPVMFGNSKAYKDADFARKLARDPNLRGHILEKEIAYYRQLESDMTKLWEKRGVVW